jgi:hypothetical protein
VPGEQREDGEDVPEGRGEAVGPGSLLEDHFEPGPVRKSVECIEQCLVF